LKITHFVLPKGAKDKTKRKQRRVPHRQRLSAVLAARRVLLFQETQKMAQLTQTMMASTNKLQGMEIQDTSWNSTIRHGSGGFV
jgi:hypothetical protein